VCQCAKHTWAHGDGNLMVFRVVSERRPNRRKVLAPTCTSAPEGGWHIGQRLCRASTLQQPGLTEQESCYQPSFNPLLLPAPPVLHLDDRYTGDRSGSRDTPNTLCIRPSSRYTRYTSHM
jgi:hypothetical protein